MPTHTSILEGMGDLKQRYSQLEKDREDFLKRGRDQSRITIPHLLPEDEHSRGEDLPEPYQSIGARGVNNLTSKLLLALFPPNAKFFRETIDEAAVEEDVEAQLTDVEDALVDIEDMILGVFEREAFRIKLFNALRQVVVTGNALLHMPANRAPRVHRLDSYVVERDPRGNIVQILTKQMVSPLLLPKKLQQVDKAIRTQRPSQGQSTFVPVYTGVFLARIGNDVKWREWQEVHGHRIGPITIHDEKRLPYVAMRMYAVDGESYGRGHVEEFMGDLRTLEGLSEAMHDAAKAAAKVLPLVNPDGVTRITRLERAKKGQYIPGKAEDVTFPQLDKFADLRVVMDQINQLERRLGQVFLLNSTVPRHAERVTAEEIRFVAQELEDTLGGVYSLMSQDLQLPIVNVIQGRLQDEGKLPKLPEFVHPVVVTGLDAIGRGHDLMRLDAYMTDALAKFGPEIIAQTHNLATYFKMRATALGIPTEELHKDPGEQQADQAAQLLASYVEKLGPTVLKEFPDEVREALEVLRQQGGVLPGGAPGSNLSLVS